MGLTQVKDLLRRNAYKSAIIITEELRYETDEKDNRDR